MTRPFRPVALCLFTVATAACSSGPPVGEYTLFQVDRKPTPETLVYRNQCVIVMMGGSMTIETEQEFRARYEIDENCASGTKRLPDPGTRGKYTYKGNDLTFTTMDGQSGGHGSFRGDTITVQGPEHELRFVRKK